jgi:ribonuclease HI
LRRKQPGEQQRECARRVGGRARIPRPSKDRRRVPWDSTNQQAEIVAACLGLEALKEGCNVELVSDSQYVVKKMNGEFRRKTNFDCWRRLDRAASRHRVKWTWVRGHAGNRMQEKCDTAAKLIAEMGIVDQRRLDDILSR